jgi:hypothetical protein
VVVCNWVDDVLRPAGRESFAPSKRIHIPLAKRGETSEICRRSRNYR